MMTMVDSRDGGERCRVGEYPESANAEGVRLGVEKHRNVHAKVEVKKMTRAEADAETDVEARAETALSILESIYSAWCETTGTESVLKKDDPQKSNANKYLRIGITRSYGRATKLGERAFFTALGEHIKVQSKLPCSTAKADCLCSKIAFI